MKMRRICVTGANGFIGRYLVDELSRQGHQITVLTRRPNSIFPAGVQVIQGDLVLPDCSLAEFVRGCEVLFHCAGEVRDVPSMYRLHVDGTQRLLQAVLNEHEQRRQELHWVQLSSVGVYGPSRGPANTERIVTENSPQLPVGEYEVTKAKADALVAQACIGGGITCSTLRPSNVLGPGMTNQSFRGLIRMVKRGLFFYIGKPGVVATYVHVDDVVAALMDCAFEPAAKGQIYNLSSDCLLDEMIDYIASKLDVRAPWLRTPELLTRTAVNLLEGWVRVPLSHSRIDALVSRTRYPADKIVSELGFNFSKAMPEAIDDLIRGESN